MIKLQTAIEKVRKEFFSRNKLGSIYEYRDFWVFDWEQECDCGSMPAVYKKTGEVFLFFPPDYLGKDIGTAKEISIPV